MFCGNCGAQVPEGSRFCLGCGAPVVTKKKKKGTFLYLLAGGLAVLGLILIFILPMFSGNKNPTDPIEHLYNAYSNVDYGELEKCFPQGMLPLFIEDNGSTEDSVRDLISGRHDLFILSDSEPISYHILKFEQYDDARLHHLCEDLSEKSNGLLNVTNITEARRYTIKIYDTYYDYEYITVFCYQGRWYLDPEELFG